MIVVKSATACGTNEEYEMKKEKIKVYIYTRVSTTMQIDGYSLDAQKARMKAFAEYNMRLWENMRMPESLANPSKAEWNSTA